jgi:hypothetical protein
VAVAPATSAVKRKPIRLPVEPVLARTLIGGLGSGTGNERGQPIAIALFRSAARGAPAIALLLARLMRMIGLGLAAGILLFARIGLRLAGVMLGLGLGLGFATEGRISLILFGILECVVARLRFRTEVRLALPELFLSRGDQPEIVFRMLIVVLGADRIAGCLGIAGELDVFFRNVRGRSTNLHIRTVRLVYPRQRILALAVAPAHPFVLTVSHGLSLIDSLLRRWPAFPRFPGTHAEPRGRSAAAGRRKSVARTRAELNCDHDYRSNLFPAAKSRCCHPLPCAQPPTPCAKPVMQHPLSQGGEAYPSGLPA